MRGGFLILRVGWRVGVLNDMLRLWRFGVFLKGRRNRKRCYEESKNGSCDKGFVDDI
ncbi:hypothetical protein [Bacillus sp. WP8]|uniref:hypothetical protein n=1 Tax=Bacillus sp. WP8 TaxID=756828 RepID=UPI0016424521|nr:hypothetical protein [Bacillus sp. WP8]